MDLNFPVLSSESWHVKWTLNISHPVLTIPRETATQKEQCKPQRKSSGRRTRSLLSCATGQHPVLPPESVQLNFSWGERSEQPSLLWRKIFNLSGPTKRLSCKRMPRRRLSKLSTSTVAMGPDHFLLCVQGMLSSPSWIRKRLG